MSASIQVERVADVNGRPAFVIVIDGAIHLAYRDAEPPHALCCDCDSCLHSDGGKQR